jgi:hypothetical protein
MVHWFANNVVLTFVVIVGLGLWLTKGTGGKFMGRLVFVLVGAYVILALLVSTVQSIEAKYNRVKDDIVGFLENRACAKFEIIGTVCDFFDLSQAKERAEDRRMQCIEDLLREDASDGGAVVKQACGIRADRAQWETCVKQQAQSHQRLADDLITRCPAFAPDTTLMHDVAEGAACPFGIKWLCTTSGSTDKPNPPKYVVDQRYTNCLNDAAVRLQQGSGKPVWSKQCADMPYGEAKDQCWLGQLQAYLPPANLQEWLTYCDSQRTPAAVLPPQT